MTRADLDPYAPLPPLRTATATALATLDPPEPTLLGPIAPGAITLVRGPRGVGKSWLALAMAHAIAGGGGLLGWTARRAPVIYIEAAMSGALLGERLRLLGPAADLKIVCDVRLDLTGEEDQARIIDSLPEGGVLVLDGLSLLARPGRGGRAEFTAWLRDLRRAGHAVVLVAPTAPPALAALADTLVAVKSAAESDGLSFAVEIASRLALAPADRAFTVSAAFADGKATWTRAAHVPSELAPAIAAAQGGGTVREIAAKLGLPTATAWRRLEKAKSLGLLPRETVGTPQPETRAPRETSGTERGDLTAVPTEVLKRTLARRAGRPVPEGAARPGPAILSGYDDAELAYECARRLKPPQTARLMARHAPALAAE
jgi:hypothetical protein